MTKFTYDELVQKLISKDQVEDNLRKTAASRYISELDQEQFVKLALKYFGVDKNDNFTSNPDEICGYMCPYSGKIVDDLSKVQLDHIIPFDDKGGTVLFNCLPCDGSANGSKKNYALLGWLKSKGYLNTNIVKRIADYMLEAYDIVFSNTTLDELNNSYKNIDLSNYNDNNSEREDDLGRAAYESAEELDKNIPISNTSYEQFILELTDYLKDNNINITYDGKTYDEKFEYLQDEKHVFKDIKAMEAIENILQDTFEEVLKDENCYLSYSMNIDNSRLLKSLDIDPVNFDENLLKQQIQERIYYIKNLLEENNVHIVDYFKSLRDIDEFNLIYYGQEVRTKENIENFAGNISLGILTKCKDFIETINMGIIDVQNPEKSIFSVHRNMEQYPIAFKNHPNVKISQNFWIYYGNPKNTDKFSKDFVSIRDMLFNGEYKDNPKYDKARENILNYEFINNNEAMRRDFIETLNNGIIDVQNTEESIFSVYRNMEQYPITFKNHPNVKILKDFWHSYGNPQNTDNKVKEFVSIRDMLFNGEYKDNPKYDKARENILNNEFINNKEAMRRDFIETLNNGIIDVQNTKESIFSTNRNIEQYPITFKNHPNVKILKDFWHSYGKKFIMPMLFEGEYKGNPKYETAKKNVMAQINKGRKVKFKDYDEYFDSLEESKNEHKYLMAERDKYEKIRAEKEKEHQQLKIMEAIHDNSMEVENDSVKGRI